MVVKTIVMLSLYMLPLLLISLGLINSPGLLIGLYILSGLGMAGIGMGIMHDAHHGAYSKKDGMNRWIGLSLDFLGCNTEIWKLQHNVLHHTYTNVAGHDEDIEAPIVLRFSALDKKYWIHRFQHYYVWLLYGLLTLNWVTTKDFMKANGYRKMGLIPDGKAYRKLLVKIISFKVIYFTYALALPIWMSPFSFWWVILGFVSMHFVAGVILSVVFQLAHVMPNMEFPDGKSDLSVNWHTHQLQTTSNFAPNNRLLGWYFGGLNHQIEHHLFPTICHIHYRKISRLVAQTAIEYGIPYHVNKTFIGAVWRHIKLLRLLGRTEAVPATVVN